MVSEDEAEPEQGAAELGAPQRAKVLRREAVVETFTDEEGMQGACKQAPARPLQ